MASPIAHRKLKRLLKAWLLLHGNYVYWQGLDSLAAPFLVLNFTHLGTNLHLQNGFDDTNV